jgi:hypothetical protein
VNRADSEEQRALQTFLRPATDIDELDVDLGYYRNTQSALEELGFRMLGDVTDARVDETFIRVMVDATGRIVAGFASVLTWDDEKPYQYVLDCMTMFIDGLYVTTTDTPDIGLPLPPAYACQRLPNASVETIVKAHRDSLRGLEDQPAYIVRDLAGAIEVSDRGDAMKLAHWEAQSEAEAETRTDERLTVHVEFATGEGSEAMTEELARTMEGHFYTHEALRCIQVPHSRLKLAPLFERLRGESVTRLWVTLWHDERTGVGLMGRLPANPELVGALGGFEDLIHEVTMEIDLADTRGLDPALAQVIDRLASLDHGRALEALSLAGQPEPHEAAGRSMKSAFDALVLPFNPTRRKIVKRNDLHRDLGGGISQLNISHPAWIRAQVHIARLLTAGDPGAELRALVEGWLAAPGRSEQEVVFFWAAFSHWWDPIAQDLESRARLPLQALRSALHQARAETSVSRLAALIRARIAISKIREAPRTAGLGTIGLVLSQDEGEQVAGVNALDDLYGGRYPRLVAWTDAMTSLDEVASQLVAALVAAGYLSAESAALYLK